MKIFWRSSCTTCEFDGLERVPRSFWMRLLPSLRHYHCNRCNAQLLAPKALVETRAWAMTTGKNVRVDAIPLKTGDPT